MNKQILVTGTRGWIDEQQEMLARTVVWKAWYHGDCLLIPDLTGVGAAVLEHANRIQAAYCVVGTRSRPRLRGVQHYINAARLVPAGSSALSSEVACWMVQQAHAATFIVRTLPSHCLPILQSARLRGIPYQILGSDSIDYTQMQPFSGETR